MEEQQEHLGLQIGEYRLLKRLGRGSFGVVYLAEHFYDHSQAAVKLLRLQLTSPKDLKDFLNEARTIRLRHVHIVPLLDFGLSRGDTPYLIMEYAAGGTLREHYPKGTKLPLETLDTYVTQLASALQYAHDRRVIHRDVKPENILLRADGTILLSDFGIAKVLEQTSFVSMQAQAVGTPAYMSPEQSRGKPCPASDQYALAVIVYEWLTGLLPFQGAPLEVMLQHRVDMPPSLRVLCAEVPILVEQVVLRALAKTPEERFGTIQEFAEALHTTLQEFSSTLKMTRLTDQREADQSVVVSSQPPLLPLPSSEPSITSGIFSALLGEIQMPPPLPRSGETEATLDSQPVELSLQPPSPEDQLPSTLSHHGSSSLVPVSSIAMSSRSYNKRFVGGTLVVILLCFVLLVSLVGGRVWTAIQHSRAFQYATATAQATPSGAPTLPTQVQATLDHSPVGTSDLTWNAANQTLTVKVALTGLAPSSTHPAHIHAGDCRSNGAIVYLLNPLVADSLGAGTSETTITGLKDGIPAKGWYINVHNGPGLSPEIQSAAIACANITNSTPSTKSNQSVHITLGGALAANESASGTAQLSIASGKLTVKLTVSGLAPSSTHIAHIHKGSCEAQGAVVYPLTSVVADASGKGTSTTVVPNVSSIPASGWYVNVHLASTMGNMATQTGFDPIACGNVVTK